MRQHARMSRYPHRAWKQEGILVAASGPDVLIKRLDPGVPLPSYAHPGDAGADLAAAEDVELGPVSGRWYGPGWRSPCPTGTRPSCIRVPGWRRSTGYARERAGNRRCGLPRRDQGDLAEYGPAARSASSVETGSLSWLFSGWSEQRSTKQRCYPDRAEVTAASARQARPRGAPFSEGPSGPMGPP